MNQTLLRKTTGALGALFASIGLLAAQVTDSSYTGATGGNWNNAAHWTPATVPNNNGGQTFNATIDSKAVDLDIDASISSLRTPGEPDAVQLLVTDHNLTIGQTDFVEFGEVLLEASAVDVKIDLGNLLAFSGTTLDSTPYALQMTAASGHVAKIQFNGANVVTNNAGLLFHGAGTTEVVDENGLDALRNFAHNLPLGFVESALDGNQLVIAQSMVNEGYFSAAEGGTVVFNGDYTGDGDLRDPNDQQGGFLQLYSDTAAQPGRFVIQGKLTNYDPATKTLHRGRYNLESFDDGIATIQVNGGPLFDIVNNDASIVMTSPGAAILDKNGDDALRNLAVNHRLRIANHDLTTVGSLTCNNDSLALLTVRGNSHMTISGNLTLQGGGLEISPLAGFDLSAPLIDSQLSIMSNLALHPNGYTRLEIFGAQAVGRISVNGNAALAGELQIFVLPNAPIITSGTVTVMTANSITGAFSNVPSGGRVVAYRPTDLAFTGQFNGAVVGSVKVTYNNHSLVISEFQPLLDLSAAASRKVHGSAGTFDIDLPLTGTPGVECRATSGNHTLVFTFTNAVTSGSASVVSGMGVVSGAPSYSGNTMTVNLNGVVNAQTIGIKLSGVTDTFSQVLPDTTVNAAFLAGDVNGDTMVNSGDATVTRNVSGQVADGMNFRADVNTDGVINSADATIVRNRSGGGLAPPAKGHGK